MEITPRNQIITYKEKYPVPEDDLRQQIELGKAY